jgi:hypothetical protein
MELLRLLNWPVKFVVFLVMSLVRALSDTNSSRMGGCKSCGTEKLFCINNTCCPGCDH